MLRALLFLLLIASISSAQTLYNNTLLCTSNNCYNLSINYPYINFHYLKVNETHVYIENVSSPTGVQLGTARNATGIVDHCTHALLLPEPANDTTLSFHPWDDPPNVTVDTSYCYGWGSKVIVKEIAAIADECVGYTVFEDYCVKLEDITTDEEASQDLAHYRYYVKQFINNTDIYNLVETKPVIYYTPRSRYPNWASRVADSEIAYVNGSSTDVNITSNDNYVIITIGTNHTNSSIEKGVYSVEVVYDCIIHVKEFTEVFAATTGIATVLIKKLIATLTPTTEISTWFSLLRDLQYQLTTALTSTTGIIRFRAGEVAFSVAETISRVLSLARTSDLPVLISESVSRTVGVARAVEAIVTATDFLGRWINVARIGDVSFSATDTIARTISVARELAASLGASALTTFTRIARLVAQVGVLDAVMRTISVDRFLIEAVSASLRLYFEYPEIAVFLLPSPPYALFVWATRFETIFVFIVIIMTAIITSTVYVFGKRHELFEHPIERFLGRKKRKK